MPTLPPLVPVPGLLGHCALVTTTRCQLLGNAVHFKGSHCSILCFLGPRLWAGEWHLASYWALYIPGHSKHVTMRGCELSNFASKKQPICLDNALLYGPLNKGEKKSMALSSSLVIGWATHPGSLGTIHTWALKVLRPRKPFCPRKNRMISCLIAGQFSGPNKHLSSLVQRLSPSRSHASA